MPPRIRKYDELGFPIPATFDDLSMPDRDSNGKPKPSAAPRPRGASRRKRIILGIILLGIVALAAIPWLMDVGQGVLGDWLADRRKRFLNHDWPGTVADSTRAFTLLGDELDDERRIELLAMRACAKLEIHDLEGSLADFDRVLASKARRGVRGECYFRRSWVNCRLHNYSAAVADASSAIQIHGRENATLLNQRAYIRALANASEEELKAGLVDIEQAMRISREDNPAFIDTHAYLLHLLGEHDKALAEIERAIVMTEALQGRMYHPSAAQKLKEDLAVMYYHLGLIHEAKGAKEQAREYLERANQFGYNPAAGVL